MSIVKYAIVWSAIPDCKDSDVYDKLMIHCIMSLYTTLELHILDFILYSQQFLQSYVKYVVICSSGLC